MSLNDLSVRIEKAAEILASDLQSITETLAKLGVSNDPNGLRLLNAQITTPDILEKALSAEIPRGTLQIRAAASYLKGIDPFQQQEPVKATTDPVVEAITQAVQANKPIQQMKDKELLELYIQDRSFEVEQELHKRSRMQPFIILQEGKFEPGKELINLNESLELLKAARKRNNPTIYPIGNKVVTVYRITELNLSDRIIEICPICGETLYKGYCQKCQVNFTGIDDDTRAYLYLIAKEPTFNVHSFSDRKAVYTSATKGLEDLKVTWPSLVQIFEEQKITNNLPKLRHIQPRPSSQVMDPFHVTGNRQY